MQGSAINSSSLIKKLIFMIFSPVNLQIMGNFGVVVFSNDIVITNLINVHIVNLKILQDVKRASTII